tara:strand:- start:78 stop:623 length:546 start_codon:yes stop_codon:yes gene_type:complete
MGKMKEKRYYKRNPYSIEDNLKDVIEKIGDKGLKEATGKGKDTFLKKSNPMHPGRHIDLKDAVDLDIYCRNKGLGTPLLDGYKTIIDKATGVSSNYKPEEIRKTVTKILEELGDVSETVSNAIKDGKVTEIEKKNISKEIKELEIEISKIKKQVGLGEKHDYKYKTGEKIKNRDEDGLKSE